MSNALNDHPGIPMMTGDPRSVPASSTRFVLPFAYTKAACLRCCPCAVPKVCRVCRRPSDPAHKCQGPGVRDYFTPETSNVLFDRAAWFKLAIPEAWRKLPGQPSATNCVSETQALNFKPARDSATRGVLLHAPWLVLFEWEGQDEPGNGGTDGESSSNLLRTGFLLIDVSFEGSHWTLDDLLLFNELFRYFKVPFTEHHKEKIESPGCSVPGKHLAGDYTAFWKAPFEKLVLKDQNKNFELRCKERDIHPDNRAYVWSCAVLEKGAQTIRESLMKSGLKDLPGSHEPHRYGHWIRLLNVDPPDATTMATHPTSEFGTDWAKERTYFRWASDGSWYGFCEHAGVAVLPPDKAPALWRHFGENYFYQVLLLLYLRTTSFRFSLELATISGHARGKGNHQWRNFLEHFQDLRWTFGLFTNLYQFPLLSNQQQGVEMYALARKAMDVEDLYGEVKQEIDASDSYLSSRVQVDLGKTAASLNIVAFFGLLLSTALTAVTVGWWQRAGSQTTGFQWPVIATFLGFAAGFFLVFLAVLVKGDVLTRRLEQMKDSLRRDVE